MSIVQSFRESVETEINQTFKYEVVKNMITTLVPVYCANYMSGVMHVDMLLSSLVAMLLSSCCLTLLSYYNTGTISFSDNTTTSKEFKYDLESNMAFAVLDYLEKTQPESISMYTADILLKKNLTSILIKMLNKNMILLLKQKPRIVIIELL